MISKHIRYQAIVHYKHFGKSLRQVARIYNVSKSSVGRWVNGDGDCVKLMRRRRRRKPSGRDIEATVRATLDANPFATATDIIRRIADTMNTVVSESTISRCRRSCGYRYKRAQRCQATEAVDDSHPFMACNPYDGAITLDESSFVSSDRPVKGWARGSARVPKAAPRRRSRISLLLAIDATGVVAFEIRKGAFNAASYSDFLSKLPPGRDVIADNCSIHKSGAARRAAADLNLRLLFTPPYCPWFNPTEFAFSKTKAAYRRARLAGSEDFVSDVREAVEEITPADCAAFFEHARRVRQIELDKPRGEA